MNKKLLRWLAPVPFALLLASCASNNSGSNSSSNSSSSTATNVRNAVEQALPYIKPAVNLACTAVLSGAVSPEDRVTKAKMIHDVANVVRSLSTGDVPSVEDLDDAVENFLPEKTHWTNFATSLSDIYKDLYSKIGDDPTLALKVLNAIADGCVSATAGYVK